MDLISRVRKVLFVIWHAGHYTKRPSYYPECERKSLLQILRDQMHFAWKYGYPEKYYFTYGFDRREMTREKMETYLVPYTSFLLQLDRLNFQNPYYDDFLGRMTCRVINHDKFYFYLFLSRLGFPTPTVYCYVKGGQVLYADGRFNIDKSQSVREQLCHLFSNDLEAFVKPADGKLGLGAFKLVIRNTQIEINGEASNMDELVERVVSADSLVQELIVQDETISALCPSSINTIRLQTVMDRNGNVIPFGPGLRIGRVGSYVDNWAKGGVFVGIDSQTGRLKDIGILKPQYGTKVHEHPDTHVVFHDYPIPYYKEAERMAVTLHKMMYRSHSIGWDIAVTSNGPVVVEGNDRWEISLIQAVHGGLGHLGKYFEW